jgi:predicted ArsR family transcriptional regulator|tara:strand:+ start:266 stop:562 length:297 start_codon:yes stop_codon:yes gene_type:complete
MYYNTTNETGEDLKESHKKAESQQEKILDIFKTSKEASPSQVMLALPVGTLITSVRRCITDLTKEGHLEKTTRKRKGIYGRPEYIWKLHSLQFMHNNS